MNDINLLWFNKANEVRDANKQLPPHHIYIAKDLNEKGAKAYACIDARELREYIESLPEDQRVLYEMWWFDQPVKLKIDHDGELDEEPSDEDLEDLENDIIVVIQSVFEMIYGKCDAEVAVERSHGFIEKDGIKKFKRSWHFTVVNYYVADQRAAHAFAKAVAAELRNRGLPENDTGVYPVNPGGNRAMRLPLCTKYGQSRFLTYDQDHFEYCDLIASFLGKAEPLTETKLLKPTQPEQLAESIEPVQRRKKKLANRKKIRAENTDTDADTDADTDNLLPRNSLSLKKSSPKPLSEELKEKYRKWIDEMIPGLKEAAVDYDSWLAMGFAFRHNGATYEQWKRFSMLCPEKYDESECERKWKREFGHADSYGGSIDYIIRKWKQLNPGCELSFMKWQPKPPIGNVPNVLNRHYLLTYEELFERNINGWASIDEVYDFIHNTVAYIASNAMYAIKTINRHTGEVNYVFCKKRKFNESYGTDEFENIREPFTLRENSKKCYKKITVKAAVAKIINEIAYLGISFQPTLHPPPITRQLKTFELFGGFAIPYDPNFVVDCSKFRRLLWHIREIWCCGDEERFQYVMGWFASMIQHPEIKVGTAILLKSRPGRGKNIVVDFIGKKLLGKQLYAYCNDIEQVIGRFNGILMNKLFTCCDEISNYGGAHRSNDKLKSLITEEQINIEHKGMEMITINDRNRYIFLTNNDWPIKVEPGDRRYVCLELDSTKKLSPDYYDALSDELNSPDCARHFFHCLAQLDLSRWRCEKIPMTNLKQELKENSIPAPIQFLKDCLSGEWKNPEITEKDGLKIHLDTFFARFLDWARATNNQEALKINQSGFSKEVSKVLNKTKSVKINKIVRCGWNMTRAAIIAALVEKDYMTAVADQNAEPSAELNAEPEKETDI
jgi:hypothetical protein